MLNVFQDWFVTSLLEKNNYHCEDYRHVTSLVYLIYGAGCWIVAAVAKESSKSKVIAIGYAIGLNKLFKFSFDRSIYKINFKYRYIAIKLHIKSRWVGSQIKQNLFCKIYSSLPTLIHFGLVFESFEALECNLPF